MSILIMTQGRIINNWVNALKEKRPDLDIIIYPDDKNREKIEFALVWNHPIGAFKYFPGIKCIASMGAGVDHILKDPDLPKNAIITKIVDSQLRDDMAEFVIALVMNHLRGLSFYKTAQQDSFWKQKSYLTIKDVTIGVMGMGVLGYHVAMQLHKQGFKVTGWSRTQKVNDDIKLFAGKEVLPEFLSMTDILICLLPLTQETENILDKDLFMALPKNAFIINVARGKHLVDNDLIEMIDNGHLSGASLDVFRTEPLPKEHPFWAHPKINITPHIASITKPESVVGQILENYDRLKNNEPLINTISPDLGY